MGLRWIALAGLVVLIAGCGEDSDIVDGPFISGSELQERACEEPTAGEVCYRLTLEVAGIAGEREASCRIYPHDTDGFELALDATVPDADPETAYHEVVLIDHLSIDLGDTPNFDVVLPVVDDERFWRWLVSCDPGAPG